jgi:hypothetical protein
MTVIVTSLFHIMQLTTYYICMVSDSKIMTLTALLLAPCRPTTRSLLPRSPQNEQILTHTFLIVCVTCQINILELNL